MDRRDRAIDDFIELTSVGLTKTQARCYGLLNSAGGDSTGEIARRLKVSRTNLYDLLQDLQRKGFVTEKQRLGVATYQVVPLGVAMASYAEYQRELVENLIFDQQVSH